MQRWFLSAPQHKPKFDPDATSAHWLAHVYPYLPASQRSQLLECTIGPGDLLYFPSFWWHAIVNVGETVFLSSFVDQSRSGGAVDTANRRPPYLRA